jgi:hypothetical protein
MNSCTKSKGAMASQSSPRRPPIFCPLCGKPHQFYTLIGEQYFIVDRLLHLHKGQRCCAEATSLTIPGTQSTIVQAAPHSPELELTCPRAVLVNVMEYLGSHEHQTHEASTPAEGEGAHIDSYTTRIVDDNAIEAQLIRESQPSPTDSEASTQYEHEPSTNNSFLFGLLPGQVQPRRYSMPGEGNTSIQRFLFRRLNSTFPKVRRAESLPGEDSNWGEYLERLHQEDDLTSHTTSRCEIPAENTATDEEKDEENTDEAASVDSDRTVTPRSVQANTPHRPIPGVFPRPNTAPPEDVVLSEEAVAIALAHLARMGLLQTGSAHGPGQSGEDTSR